MHALTAAARSSGKTSRAIRPCFSAFLFARSRPSGVFGPPPRFLGAHRASGTTTGSSGRSRAAARVMGVASLGIPGKTLRTRCPDGEPGLNRRYFLPFRNMKADSWIGNSFFAGILGLDRILAILPDGRWPTRRNPLAGATALPWLLFVAGQRLVKFAGA